MKDSIECYKILGLEPGCSAERIREAYLQLSRFYNPERYAGETDHQETAKQKRDEVEIAYQSLRRFLPELQGPPGKHSESVRLARDFKEMERETSIERTRAVMGVLVAIVLIFIFAWAYFLLSKGQHSTPVPTPIE